MKQEGRGPIGWLRLCAGLTVAAALWSTGCAGGTAGIASSVRVLASGLGMLRAIALAGPHAYVVEVSGTGARILAIALATGAATEVATAEGEIPSICAHRDGCVYIDGSAKTVDHASTTSEVAVLNRSASHAARAVAASDSAAYWLDGTGANLISLDLPDGLGTTDPPPPLSFPRVLATTENAQLLAVGSDRIWLSDRGGLRLASVALAGGTPEAVSPGLGTVRRVAADGALVAAAGTSGLFWSGAVEALPNGAAPSLVGLVARGAVAGRSDAVFLAESTSSPKLVTGASGLVDLDSSGSSIVLAENTAQGGRVRLVQLPPAAGG